MILLTNSPLQIPVLREQIKAEAQDRGTGLLTQQIDAMIKSAHEFDLGDYGLMLSGTFYFTKFGDFFDAISTRQEH